MRKVEPYTAGDGTTTYKVRFRLNGKQTSETFTTEPKAARFTKLLDVLGSAGAIRQLYGQDQADYIPDMDELAADHIKHLTGIEEGTRLNYTRLWNRTWSSLIGRLPADTPDLRDKIALATNELATRYSHKSLKNQRGLLHGVCERGIEKGYIVVNPTRKLRLPQGTVNPDLEDDHEMRLLEQPDFGLLAAAMSPRYQPLVRFLAGTGCRWGEAVVLRPMDFSLKPVTGKPYNPVVRIRRALKWSPDGKRVIGVTKTVKSKRTIALPVEIVPELDDLIEGKGSTDLVFTSARGGMVQHRTFWSDHWRPAIWRAQHCADHTDEACRCGTAHPERCKLHDETPEACGCPGTLPIQPRIHDLRHSHASWLLAAGVPIHVVQARLGHESIQTTVDTYGHLLPDAQLAAALAASAAFAPPSEPAAIEA